jgi:hypothetical protein
MNHTEIINALIKKFGYKSFLEIGTQNGVNFEKIECAHKVGVDPDHNSKTIHYMTSDEFFDINTESFDICFLDGDHNSISAHRDIVNAYCCLNPGGTIVVHDLLPTDELMQRVPRESKIWTGDVWKSWIKCRRLNDDLEMMVVDCDWGVGLIREGQQETLKINQPLTYDDFERNKQEWMNIITVEQFNEWLNNPIEKKSRCCGRCDGVNDICVTDMICEEHSETGCKICYK